MRVGDAYEARDADARGGYHAAQGFTGFRGPGDGPLDGGGDALGLSDVNSEELGRRGQLLRQGRSVVFVQVQEGDIAALLGDLFRRSSAEAGCSGWMSAGKN